MAMDILRLEVATWSLYTHGQWANGQMSDRTTSRMLLLRCCSFKTNANSWIRVAVRQFGPRRIKSCLRLAYNVMRSNGMHQRR